MPTKLAAWAWVGAFACGAAVVTSGCNALLGNLQWLGEEQGRHRPQVLAAAVLLQHFLDARRPAKGWWNH